MSQPPIDPERVADETAQRLLARATALDDPQLTLDQLRDAASEAGISRTAFDAAVTEWRQSRVPVSQTRSARLTATSMLRNMAGIAAGWMSVAILAGIVRVTAAPWLTHKLTDALGVAIGALVAAKLRARTATIILGGLAVSQGAEFAMELLSGGPAIQGFGAHIGLMVAGVAGVALGFWLHRARSESEPSDPTRVGPRDAPSRDAADSSRSRSSLPTPIIASPPL